MGRAPHPGRLRRREFLALGAGAALAPWRAAAGAGPGLASPFQSTVYSVEGIPDNPYTDPAHPNRHAGVEGLLALLELGNLRFYRTAPRVPLGGPIGLIGPDDVVLIKVNAQWKYRGATNSDVVRGIVQRVLDHPDGFRGEVVIFENGQGRGSLACDTSSSYGGDASVRANALNEAHSFLYLVDSVFKDRRVSAFLLDPVRAKFIGPDDHLTNGYRRFEDVSYPCFTTAGGNRVELREGIWNGSGHDPRLKLISVPVLKTHGGSEFTGALKHFYGVLSMSDGGSDDRHYDGLGRACGKMVQAVRTPVLTIMDAIWISWGALGGYPASATFNAKRLAASQDPLALDYWAAKNILYPIKGNAAHDPDNATISAWMASAEDTINGRGGLFKPWDGILVKRANRDARKMLILRGGPA
jgi:hypothetical protein